MDGGDDGHITVGNEVETLDFSRPSVVVFCNQQTLSLDQLLLIVKNLSADAEIEGRRAPV